MTLESLSYYALAVFLLPLLYLAYARRKRSEGGAHPPGPNPYPIIGNILDVLSPTPWLIFMKWEEQYHSKILSYALPGARVVVLNALEDAVEILEKRASIYSDRAPVHIVQMAGWGFNTGLMSNNERWRQERRIFLQTFKPESMHQFLPIQSAKVNNMMRQLITDPTGISDHCKLLIGAIVLEIMYGYEVKSRHDRILEVAERAVRTMIEVSAIPSVAALNLFPILRHLPRWVPGTEFHDILDKDRQYVHEMLNEPYDYVRKSIREGTAKSSLVRSLLEANVLGEESVKGIAATAFAAGTDAVGSTLESFFFAMALYPEVQKKAREELDRVVGTDRLPTFKDRESLPYVEAVYREIYRWIPVLPLTVPHLSEADDSYKGYYLPKGTIIHPNVWAMTHDPAKYKDPDVFMPERYFDENGNLNDDTRNLAFGFGRRLCAGRYLATSTVWLTVASVLATLDIGAPYDYNDRLIKFQEVVIKADSLHMRPYKCSITPRSEDARKLLEATEGTTGY